MKILDKSIALSTLVTSNTNGLGHVQPLSCLVTEELNGGYEAEFQVLTTDKYFDLLENNGLVKIKVGDGSEQIFRIYSISKPINFVVTVKAAHITYDLSKVVVTPFTATGAVNTKNQMLAHILGTYPFDMTTDISNTTSTFNLTIPRSFRECLGGYEGSLLDVFRGEYEYDNLTVKMLARRGADNGVRIAYGKNLTDFNQELNNQNVYDAVYGYAVVDEVTYQASGIYNKTGATTPKVKNVDFSNKYDTGEVPTAAELLAYATTYATNNDIEVPRVSMKVSFIPLWQTDEYKSILPLERVKLGDTVHIFFDELGVEASSRVVKTVWNTLTEKYDEIELGDKKSNLNTVIDEAVDQGLSEALDDLDVDVGWLDNKIENMAELIANGLGLHITIDSIGRIFLHNAEDLASSQYQYQITSGGFMMSDDYGQTWNSGWDISGNAVMNSLSTITLRALEIYGSYIEGSQILFGDHNDKYILAQVYNDGTDDVGVTFDGSGYVRFQPQEKFIVNNLTSGGDLLNEFVMSKSGTYSQAYITLKNYDHVNHLLANSLNFDERYSSTMNRMMLENYQTTSDTQYLSNKFVMEASTTYGYINLYNKKFQNASDDANTIRMYSASASHTLDIKNFDISDVNLANSLGFSSSSIVTFAAISNYQTDTDGLANRLIMRGLPLNSNDSTGNYVQLANYDIDNSNSVRSAELYMKKTSSSNQAYLNIYRSGTTIAHLMLNRDSNANASVSVGTLAATINNKNYKRAEILMESDTGNIRMFGTHLYFNGTQID